MLLVDFIFPFASDFKQIFSPVLYLCFIRTVSYIPIRYILVHAKKFTAYHFISARYIFGYVGLITYEGWNFNGGNYLFTTDTK